MYFGSQSSVGLKEHLLCWRAKELFLRASETGSAGARKTVRCHLLSV
jgi:hypothetical protein